MRSIRAFFTLSYMSYHCSLSAIRPPTGGKASRRFFRPPEYSQGQGFASVFQLFSLIGPQPGEWRLATKFYLGQFRGLDRTTGMVVAYSGTKALVMHSDGKNFTIGHKDNFLKVESEESYRFEKPTKEKKESERTKKFLLEYC